MAPKKGRSFELVAERNVALITRYWYWSEIWQRRHENVLDVLTHQEFFLMPARIEAILRSDNVVYTQLCAERPSPKELNRRFPAFKFEENPYFGNGKKQVEVPQGKLF